jgi:hypothetical protein
VPEVEVHEPGELIAQIAVQGGFHQGQQPARGNNHELVKRLTPVGSKQTPSKLPCVLGALLLEPAPAGPPRVAVGGRAVPFLLEAGELHERPWPASEQPRRGPAEHCDTPVSWGEHGGERLKPRGRVDHCHRFDGARQWDRLVG